MNESQLLRAAIVGVHESPVRSAPDVHPFALQADCVREALDDAGIAASEVDGLCTCVGDFGEGGASEDITELADYLGLQPTYIDSTDVGGCSFMIHAAHAAAAIAAKLVNVVVITYAATPRWWPVAFPSLNESVLPAGLGQWELPYAYSLVAIYALWAQRHMHEFGTTPEQLARVAVLCRENAAKNPDARYREPITVDDVLASPMIATPLHRLDCCVLTDGAGALVMTSAERAADTPKPVVKIAGAAEAVTHMNLSTVTSFTTSPASITGPRAMHMAGIMHDDIDVLQIYDGFTITPLIHLEDLGFCRKGEGGPFIEDGNVSATGRWPMNTDGGGMSSNQPGKRGLFALIEAVRQLRGEGPGHQVPNAEVALVHGMGGMWSAGATIVLTK